LGELTNCKKTTRRSLESASPRSLHSVVGGTALTAKLLENAVENPAGVADANGDGISAIPRATGAKLAGLIDRTVVPV
jgi:hypothetical protein